MPTVLELVGLPAPRNCDGHSLLPFCAGETPTGWRDEVCWSFDFRDIQTRYMEQAFGLPSEWCNLQVMRTDKLKYVHFAGLPPVVFDLADDPHELTNRGRHPAKASLRLEGLDRMMNWRRRHEERTLTGFLARSGKFYKDEV
jgi:arylsulfatase A-like enzyme